MKISTTAHTRPLAGYKPASEGPRLLEVKEFVKSVTRLEPNSGNPSKPPKAA